MSKLEKIDYILRDFSNYDIMVKRYAHSRDFNTIAEFGNAMFGKTGFAGN